MIEHILFSFNNYTVFMSILPRSFNTHTYGYCEKWSMGLGHKQKDKCAGKLWKSCFWIARNFLSELLLKSRICYNCFSGLHCHHKTEGLVLMLGFCVAL